LRHQNGGLILFLTEGRLKDGGTGDWQIYPPTSSIPQKVIRKSSCHQLILGGCFE
jgi:hypothetical protein